MDRGQNSNFFPHDTEIIIVDRDKIFSTKKISETKRWLLV